MRRTGIEPDQAVSIPLRCFEKGEQEENSERIVYKESIIPWRGCKGGDTQVDPYMKPGWVG